MTDVSAEGLSPGFFPDEGVPEGFLVLSTFFLSAAAAAADAAFA